jgi:hypothetical protein
MKSAILLETADIKWFSRGCYVFSAAAIDRAHFFVLLPKVGESGPTTVTTAIMVRGGRKT